MLTRHPPKPTQKKKRNIFLFCYLKLGRIKVLIAFKKSNKKPSKVVLVHTISIYSKCIPLLPLVAIPRFLPHVSRGFQNMFKHVLTLVTLNHIPS